MTINLSLTEESIDKAIADLQKFEQHIKDRTTELIAFMTTYGEEVAYNYISHVDTGETVSSVIGYREGNKGLIMAGGNAVWLEFGTGVARNGDTPEHPARSRLGISPIGTYGKGNGSNPDGWYYKDESGKWRHTKGIKADMFMYKTAEEIKKRYIQWAKQIFQNM